MVAVLIAAALAMINPLEQFYKSTDSRRKSDLAQIQKALEIYYQDHNEYPYQFQNKLSSNGTSAIDWGTDFRPYMDVLPIDPAGAKNYGYWTDSTRQSYALYASLDRGNKDPQACDGGNPCSGTIGTGIGGANILCGGVCNYGVSSPNISP